MPTLIANNLGVISSEKVQIQQSIPEIKPVPAESHPVKTTTVWEAAEQADRARIREFLRTDVQIANARDPTTGATLLQLVLSSTSPTATAQELDQRLEIVRLLLANGADASSSNLYGVQAIHMVPLFIPTHSLPFLNVLVDHVVDINARDGDDWTVLHYAARFSQPPQNVMEMLVARGAKVNQANIGKKSCLFCLVANGDFIDCFRWMVESAKADVAWLDGNRDTLMLQAVKYGRLSILRYLIHDVLDQLKPVISLKELSLVQQQRHGKAFEKEIEQLTLVLEQDPRSLVAKQQRVRRSMWHKLLRLIH